MKKIILIKSQQKLKMKTHVQHRYYYYNGIGSNGGGLYTARELRNLAIKNNSLFNPPFDSSTLQKLTDNEIVNELGAFRLEA